MDRKRFFRNAFGALIATAIGSKLDWVPDVTPLRVYPLTPPECFLPKKWFFPNGTWRSGDIIIDRAKKLWLVNDKDKNGVYRCDRITQDPKEFEVMEIHPLNNLSVPLEETNFATINTACHEDNT